MKTCKCGFAYRPRRARNVGTMSFRGQVIWLTDCPRCGSTCGIQLVPHPDDARARVEANPN